MHTKSISNIYFLYIYTIEITTKTKNMKTSINFQKTMNTYLTKKQFRLAYKSFLKMNNLRVLEGKEFLSMPNLQSKFEA